MPVLAQELCSVVLEDIAVMTKLPSTSLDTIRIR